MNAAQLDALLRLPVTDRIRLVEVIWNSILESSADPEVVRDDEAEVGAQAATPGSQAAAHEPG